MAEPQVVQSRRAILILALAALSTLARLHFGVDVTDEAYYAAFPWRFALGDVPYLSDVNLHQNAGTLLWPWVVVHRSLLGDATGLILSLRALYWLVYLGLSVFAYATLRGWMRPEPAALTAALPLLFVLHGIPSLSYNTLPAATFALALLSSLAWADSGKARWAALSGASYVLSAYAYPPGLPAAALGWLAIVLIAPDATARRMGIRGLAAVLTVTMIATAIVVAMWWPGLVRALALGGSFTGGSPGLRRVGGLGVAILLDPVTWRLLPLLGCLVLVDRRRPELLGVVGTIYVLAIAGAPAQMMIVWLGIAGAFLFRTGSGKLDAGLVLVLVSLTYGVLAAFFSTNGWLAAAVGSLIPAMLALSHVASRAARAPTRWVGRTFFMPVAVTAGLLLVTQWTVVYRDDPVTRLTATVTRGPYWGLRTTPEKREFLHRIQAAIDVEAPSASAVVSFNRFPAGALMVSTPPALPTTWVPDFPHESGVEYQRMLAGALATAPRPLLAVQVHRIINSSGMPTVSRYSRESAFFAAFEDSRPRVVVEGSDFTLYWLDRVSSVPDGTEDGR